MENFKNIEVKNKEIIKTFISLDGKDFEWEEVINAIDDMLNTGEDESIWGDCLRDYELSSSMEIYEYFIKLGLVKNQMGERQANLFCMTKGAKEKFLGLRDSLYDEKDLVDKSPIVKD